MECFFITKSMGRKRAGSGARGVGLMAVEVTLSDLNDWRCRYVGAVCGESFFFVPSGECFCCGFCLFVWRVRIE